LPSAAIWALVILHIWFSFLVWVLGDSALRVTRAYAGADFWEGVHLTACTSGL